MAALSAAVFVVDATSVFAEADFLDKEKYSDQQREKSFSFDKA